MSDFVNQAFAELQETYGRTASNTRAVLSTVSDLYKQAADTNISFLKEQAATTRADLAPYVQAGNQGSRYLQILLGMGDPGGEVKTKDTNTSGSQAGRQSQIDNLQKNIDYQKSLKDKAGNPQDRTDADGFIKMYQDQIDTLKGGMSPANKAALDSVNGQRAQLQTALKSAGSPEAAQSFRDQLSALDNQSKQISDHGWDSLDANNNYTVKSTTQTTDSGSLFSGGPAEQQQAYINQILASPYVASQIKTGTDAVQRSNASKGMMGSGRVLEQLQQVGQDAATSQIASVQNALMGMMSSGANAAGMQAQLNSQLGKDVSQQNMWGTEGQASAKLKSAQVYADSELAMANNKFQGALSGQLSPGTSDSFAASGPAVMGAYSAIGMFL